MSPTGSVDPTDPAGVADVVGAVLSATGPDGLLDLLARLPGVRVQAPTAGRLLRAAQPGRAWLGPEDVLVLGGAAEHRQVEHQQVVGGVVLHRRTPSRGELPGVVAALVVRLTRDEASYDESTAVLTAAREAAQRW